MHTQRRATKMVYAQRMMTRVAGRPTVWMGPPADLTCSTEPFTRCLLDPHCKGRRAFHFGALADSGPPTDIRKWREAGGK